MRASLAAWAAALLASAAPAGAQDRPPEEELFGAPAAAQDRTPEEELFGAPQPPPPPTGEVARERDDPLRLGGLVYLRLEGTVPKDVAVRDSPIRSPDIVDVFLDARPSEHVRAFLLERMFYDAIVPETATGAPPQAVPPQLSTFVLADEPANPRFALDQLWVNFDLGRRAFLTVGRQHVKWGVGRFWNPTDYLHRQPRDPLDPFDVRTGTAMVKLHVPWERRGWNVYGVALLEDTREGAVEGSGTLRGVPLGARLELVLGTAEVGLDFLAGAGARPRYGLDVSAGVWELDLRGEVAIGAALPRWRVVDPAAPELAEVGKGRYGLFTETGPAPQVVVGAEWSRKWSDDDLFTVGAEYYFQDDGYGDSDVYPFLAYGAPASTLPLTLPDGGLNPDARIYRQDPPAFTVFRLGRHYAGLYGVLPSPGSWNDTTFTLSALANLSDRSAIVRLDHSVVVLTYLRVETFLAAHVGESGGEFRFGLALPPPLDALGFDFPEPRLDFGVAVRVSL